jgi:hypothetical protein
VRKADPLHAIATVVAGFNYVTGGLNVRRGLGGPRDQQPPRNRCGVRWLELWHVAKEAAALSGAVFDCRAVYFAVS